MRRRLTHVILYWCYIVFYITDEAKASSNLSPHLIMIREGIDDCKPFFDAAFIEDAAKRGAGSSADYGYPPFLEAISTEVKTFLTEL